MCVVTKRHLPATLSTGSAQGRAPQTSPHMRDCRLTVDSRTFLADGILFGCKQKKQKAPTVVLNHASVRADLSPYGPKYCRG